jgi:hypothetical protein
MPLGFFERRAQPEMRHERLAVAVQQRVPVGDAVIAITVSIVLRVVTPNDLSALQLFTPEA